MGAVALPVAENPAHPLRKKLWLGAGALTLLVLTIAIGNSIIDRKNAITADAVGHDFIAFYTAGHFLREGRAERIPLGDSAIWLAPERAEWFRGVVAAAADPSQVPLAVSA